MGFSFGSDENNSDASFDSQSASDVATFRKTMAEKSATTKITSNTQQMKDIVLTTAQYSLSEVAGSIPAVPTVSEVGDAVIGAISSAVSNLVNDVFGMIDEALSKVTGLLGEVLKQTAMSEKVNEIKSESIGISSRLTNVSNGIQQKVKDMKSINDLIRYDNWSHTANRFNNKAQSLKDNSSTLLSAVKSATDIIGISNTILNAVNEGTKQITVSFSNFQGILPELNMSKFIPPIPQISCPSLPKPPEMPEGSKMDERNTVQAVKAVKSGIKDDMQKALSSAIGGLASQIEGLAKEATDAFNSISSAIATVQKCMPQNMVTETMNGISTMESTGSNLSSLNCPTIEYVTQILDTASLNTDLTFNFNSCISIELGLNEIDPRLQQSLLDLASAKIYIDAQVDLICDITPAVDAWVGIPNDLVELEQWLGVYVPPVIEVNAPLISIKSTTEPLNY